MAQRSEQAHQRLLDEIAAEKAAARRFNESCRQARLQRWYLEVQREAIGLRRHGFLEEFYSVPAPIRD